ncbi:MAG TPA: BON domain-containing protein [Candidatus Limnocylindrales bacterium]|jgi:osmotically-inducible protein OsmY|nr:BON domain-containing protein [Candidatus Limnocylindrales bacterium]
MKILKWVTCVGVVGLLAGCNPTSESSGGAGSNQASGSNSGQGASAPDNTGRNVRDRSDSTVTPGDQGPSDADRDITRRIRRALNRNDQLSADAKNIKVIAINGKVTLRGPVKNRQELETIQSIVQQAGVSSFDNQLEIEATNQ